MEILNEKMQKEVKGGSITLKVVWGLVTVGSFIVGVVDGFIRPLKCRR